MRSIHKTLMLRAIFAQVCVKFSPKLFTSMLQMMMFFPWCQIAKKHKKANQLGVIAFASFFNKVERKVAHLRTLSRKIWKTSWSCLTFLMKAPTDLQAN